ncbi:MAG: ABC transporter ATP-binding protein [Planctomycetes bacterium]|nr:ABC transporter ATP-binding protein [Planctomycetota bacterium]
MAENIAVSVRGLTKQFGSQVTALYRVSFDAPEKSLFGLLGPNGAGKTTLFSIAANFLQATEGYIEVLGINVLEISRLRGRFAMLPQDAQFDRNVPIVEQMITFCRLNGETRYEAQQSADEALDIVGLTEAGKRAARTLSHGMTKRLALAQAFLGDPDVVFLDEPTSGLDPQNAASIRALIREMAGKRTVVISSHNLAEIQQMCSHCAILHEGEIVSCGEMSELLGTEHTIRITFGKSVSPQLIVSVQDLPGVSAVEQPASDEMHIHLLTSDSSPKETVVESILSAAASQGYVPRTINEGSRLEERFLEMTGGGTGDNLGST